MTIYELPDLQRRLLETALTTAKERFPEIQTSDVCRYQSESERHIVASVLVPFYDDERELAFWDFTAELSQQIHEDTGVLISLLPRYEAALA